MTVLFVYSTGRCATQWLAKNFAANVPGAVVEHEPIGPQWAPRRALRHPDLAALRRELPEVDRHLRRVSEIAGKGRSYIETGWPAFAWIPYLKEIFGGRFRWVHLVRNPLYVAASLVTHRFYDARRRDDYSALAMLEPSDPGVAYSAAATQWPDLSQFEKCLYHWLEINRYGLELAAHPALAPAAVMRFEDLFSGSAEPLRRFYAAAGLQGPAAVDGAPVDKFRRASPVRPQVSADWLRREVAVIAGAFGYEPADIDPDGSTATIQGRYAGDGRRGDGP